MPHQICGLARVRTVAVSAEFPAGSKGKSNETSWETAVLFQCNRIIDEA